MKNINSKKVNVTAAGYAMIDGERVTTKLNPLNVFAQTRKIEDSQVREYIIKIVHGRWTMVQSI